MASEETKAKGEEINATPFKFPADVDITDKDCAAWLNDSLEGISIWSFI